MSVKGWGTDPKCSECPLFLLCLILVAYISPVIAGLWKID